MLNPFVTCIGKIKDIQNREDLILITDSLEVEYIQKHIGNLAPNEDQIEFSGLFVLVAYEDYEEMFSFEGYVAYLDKDLWRLDTQINC